MNLTCKILISSLMILASACGESFKIIPNDKKDTYEWSGTVSSVLNHLLPSAYASENICLSTCTSADCAQLNVLKEDGSAEEICKTNVADTYSFKFNQDPDLYFNGKLIEIKILKGNQLTPTRSLVQLIDRHYPQPKDISLYKSLESIIIKPEVPTLVNQGKTVVSAYEKATQDYDEDLLRNAFRAFLNLTWVNISEQEKDERIHNVINYLEPSYVKKYLEKWQLTNEEESKYQELLQLCQSKGAAMYFSMDVSKPYCWLKNADLEQGRFTVWHPNDDIVPQPTLPETNSNVPSDELQVIGPPIAERPSVQSPSYEKPQPAQLNDFTDASMWLAQNFQNYSCMGPHIRGEGSPYIPYLDTSLPLVDYSTGLKTQLIAMYAKCRAGQLEHAWCEIFDPERLKSIQLESLTQQQCI